MHVDLRTDKTSKHGTRFLLFKKRCGCVCKRCKWRGSRVIDFWLNLGQRFSYVDATTEIKGKASRWKCPICFAGLPGSVVFTHVPWGSGKANTSIGDDAQEKQFCSKAGPLVKLASILLLCFTLVGCVPDDCSCNNLGTIVAKGWDSDKCSDMVDVRDPNHKFRIRVFMSYRDYKSYEVGDYYSELCNS